MLGRLILSNLNLYFCLDIFIFICLCLFFFIFDDDDYNCIRSENDYKYVNLSKLFSLFSSIIYGFIYFVIYFVIPVFNNIDFYYFYLFISILLIDLYIN